MSEGTTFRTVLRGYEPTEVDRAVADLQASLNHMRDRAAELEQQLATSNQQADPARLQDATARAEQAEARLRAVQEAHAKEAAEREAAGPPEPAEASYEHLGARVGQMMGLARDEAADIRLRAAADAKAHREEVEAGALALREDAERYAA